MAMNRGNLDVLHLRELYGEWPTVRAYDGPLPERFVSWANRKRARPEDGLHFFTDDDRIEPVWKRPDTATRWVEGRVITGPDFSLWPEMPRAMLDWQVYRARWLARALEERGAKVIQTASWAADYVGFQGMRATTTVAISAYGAKKAGEMFRYGYERLVGTLLPKRVVVIGGTMPDWLKEDAKVTYYRARTIGDGRTR